MQPLLRCRKLTKLFGDASQARKIELIAEGLSRQQTQQKYGQVLALRDVSFDLHQGQTLVVVGLSGSGKSTLVRLINRLIDPNAGEIYFGDDNILDYHPAQLRTYRQNSVSMVFQNFALAPHMDVLHNVALGLRIKGVAKKLRHQQAHEWIARVGLSDAVHQYPSQLSGGMKQRVGIARALVNGAELLLMDEPFSSLDPLIRTEMQTLLLELQRDLHKTIVFISHDPTEAVKLGDRIAAMRDGEIIQLGTPAELKKHPADEFIRHFFSTIG